MSLAAAPARPAEPVQINQTAFVVRDVDDTLENFTCTLGWGPWNVYELEPPELHDTYVRGVPTDFTMILAMTQVGPIEVEVIQPLEGPSIYREWLDDHGEGLHHLAVVQSHTSDFEDDEATRAHFEKLGAPVLMEGRIGGSHFWYFDTQPVLKAVFETVAGRADGPKLTRVYPSER